MSSNLVLEATTALAILLATVLLLVKGKYFIKLGYSSMVKTYKDIVYKGKVKNFTKFFKQSSSKSDLSYF